MALGKTCVNTGSEHVELMDKSLVFVPITRILGRKRVVVSNNMEASKLSSPISTVSLKRRGRRLHLGKQNRLVSLPEDVLVRILCKVNHSDLKHLLLVSKFVHKTTLIARELHFAFSTPSSKPVFSRDRDLGGEGSEEPPNAPKQHRVAKLRIDRGKLASVAVALFASEEEQWPTNDSAVDM